MQVRILPTWVVAVKDLSLVEHQRVSACGQPGMVPFLRFLEKQMLRSRNISKISIAMHDGSCIKLLPCMAAPDCYNCTLLHAFSRPHLESVTHAQLRSTIK